MQFSHQVHATPNNFNSIQQCQQQHHPIQFSSDPTSPSAQLHGHGQQRGQQFQFRRWELFVLLLVDSLRGNATRWWTHGGAQTKTAEADGCAAKAESEVGEEAAGD